MPHFLFWTLLDIFGVQKKLKNIFWTALLDSDYSETLAILHTFLNFCMRLLCRKKYWKHWIWVKAVLIKSCIFFSQFPDLKMPFVPGYEEDGFLKGLSLKLEDIEPKADNCTKVCIQFNRFMSLLTSINSSCRHVDKPEW